MLYPVKKGDWYKSKGYGKDGKDPFDDFIETQKTGTSDKTFRNENGAPLFETLEANRHKVKVTMTNGHETELDSITILPNNGLRTRERKPGNGRHIINIFGRTEFYESKWRELTTDAKNIGATIHAFNAPGMYASKGEVLCFNDLVNCGLAQVNSLLEKGIKPGDIIIKGNSLGAAVATEVQHKCALEGINIRVINSNSYSTMKEVITEAPYTSFPKLRTIQSLIDKMLKGLTSILDFTGWNPDISQKYLSNVTPYNFVVHREEDKVVPERAQMQYKLSTNRKALLDEDPSIARDLAIPGFEQSAAYLSECNKMVPKNDKEKGERHKLSMHQMCWIDEQGKKREPWELFAEYIRASNEYISNNPGPKLSAGTKAALYSEHAFPVVPKAQLNEYKNFADTVTSKIGHDVSPANKRCASPRRGG